MSTPTRLALYRFLAGVVGAALIATGCGSGGGGGKATTIAPLTSLPVTTTIPPPGQHQLQSILIQQSDLPIGWTATPAAPANDEVANPDGFAQCLGTPTTSGDTVAAAFSPTFVNGSGLISSAATSFKSASDVQADTAALANPKASDCFVQGLKARLTAALPKTTTVKVALKFTPAAGSGPSNIVATATGTVSFTRGGHTVTLNNDIVFFAAPRVETHVSFYTSGKAIPASVKSTVLNMVSARLTNVP